MLLVLGIIIALLGVGLYHYVPSELAPEEDTNIVFVSASGPAHASFLI